MQNENEKSYTQMSVQELRDGIAAVLRPDSVSRTPEGNTQSPDELRAAYILAKRTDQITPDDRLFLAQGIAEFERTRNL